MVGVNPEVGHEQMSNLNFTHGIAQALWQGKLFHIDLNRQNGPKFDQDLIFGHGNHADVPYAQAAGGGVPGGPEVQEALAAARVAELSQPTLGHGETYDDLLADRSAWEDFDPDAAGAPGYGFVRLAQLAVEHLTGAR